MPKSAQAFRTIREVADWLDVAAHVLRFWESKFTQIKPVKRAGGRRYYRPTDMELVGGIKVLLHERGLTIRGVQKLIADEGLEAVMALSPPVEDLLAESNVIDLDPEEAWDEDAAADAGNDIPNEDGADLALPIADSEQSGQTDESDTIHMRDVVATSDPRDDAPTSDTAVELDVPEPELPGAAAPAETPVPSGPPSRPPPNPAEGRLGVLAALASLPAENRKPFAPHITALAALRDRMAAPVQSHQSATDDHS